MSITENVHFKTAISSQFTLEIGKLKVERIQTVSGIAISMEALTSSVGVDHYKRKRPSEPSVEDITIKRAFFHDDKALSDYWKLWADDSDGKPDDGAIALFNNGGAGASKEVARWNFFGCFPVKYSISDFDAASADIVYEELTLTFERLVRA